MSEKDSGAQPPLTRKRFIDWLLGTSAGGFLAAVVYPVVRYIIPPEVPESAVNSVTLALRPDEVPSNTGRIFKFGNRPGLLVKTASGELRAFSARCTHLDCTVQYREDLGHIWCACHNGHFDLNGRNIEGPPPEPLPVFDVNVRGEQIVVSLRA
ncbi:MAG TPA: Rieske (2Fe-2S) protein [Longimicrobiales bacterium]|nr:Rieske (2Fe-2S) protein [Longimicrobiales bacterium]